MSCNASNSEIACEGPHIEAEGLCLTHAVLFNVWIDEGGYRVYGSNYPLRWKRSKFMQWLNELAPLEAKSICGGFLC